MRLMRDKKDVGTRITLILLMQRHSNTALEWCGFALLELQLRSRDYEFGNPMIWQSMIGRPNNPIVRLSLGRTIRLSLGRTIRLSLAKVIRLSLCKTIRLSLGRAVRLSLSESEVIRKRIYRGLK